VDGRRRRQPHGTLKAYDMSNNMSYCRFQNTLPDLKDCYEAMDEDDLSFDERRARWSLIRLCRDIANDYGHEADEPRPKREPAVWDVWW